MSDHLVRTAREAPVERRKYPWDEEKGLEREFAQMVVDILNRFDQKEEK